METHGAYKQLYISKSGPSYPPLQGNQNMVLPKRGRTILSQGLQQVGLFGSNCQSLWDREIHARACRRRSPIYFGHLILHGSYVLILIQPGAQQGQTSLSTWSSLWDYGFHLGLYPTTNPPSQPPQKRRRPRCETQPKRLIASLTGLPHLSQRPPPIAC